QEVRDDVQRPHDALARGEGEAEPDAEDESGQGPLHLGAVVARPQDDHRHDDGGAPGEEGQEDDAALVGDRPIARPASSPAGPVRHSLYRCRRRYRALRLSPRASAAWLTLPLWRASVLRMRNDSTSSRLISSRLGWPS